MEVIIFVGIQGSGKSQYYKDNFADTHIRINLDMLKTRHREHLLFQACLQAKQPVVVDNTNLTAKDRAKYIVPAMANRFTVIAYHFDKPVMECIANNQRRAGKTQIPQNAIFSASKKLEVPTREEGFSEIIVIN